MKTRIIGILLTALMVVGTIAGCSNKTTTDPNKVDKSSSKGTATDTIKLRLAASLASLDWEQSTSSRATKVWHQMYEGLYGMDESKDGYYKELAKDVKISDDKKVYTITLQDGVKFQNGEPLKSSDVVFTYKRSMTKPMFNYVTNMIADVAAVDDSTVKITLKTPFSAIDHTFFTIKILSKKEVTEQGDKFGTIPNKAGTGAYYVTEYNVATGLKLKAFEGYWRGAPNIKAINYRVISDNSAAVIAYENHEIDYLEDAPLSDWNSLKKASGQNNALVKGNNILFMAVNYLSPTNNKILANDKVRQAIFYVVNKKDINSAVCNGYGTETNYYMPPEYVTTSPKDGFKTYDFDIAKQRNCLPKQVIRTELMLEQS